MKHLKISFVIWLLLGCDPLFADLMIVQTLEDLQNNQVIKKEEITFYVSNKRFRIDQGKNLSSIILNDKKVTYSIMHGSRQYVKLPHEAFQDDTSSNQRTSEKPKIETTGKKEELNGHLCRQVLIKENDGSMSELWIANHAIDLKTCLEEFNRFMDFGLAQAFKELEKYPELQGLPIRIIEYVQNQPRRQCTITRLDTKKIDPSFFEVPTNYTAVKLSDMP